MFRWDALSELRCLSGLKSVAFVMLHDNVELGHGIGTLAERRHETKQEEIRNSQWHVDNLREETEKSGGDGQWVDGKPPAVRLCIW